MSALLITSVVTGVGIAIRDELIETGGGAVDRVDLIVPGDIAWDGCDCGQLAQTITQTFPSDVFPQPANDAVVTKCTHKMIVASVTASVVRCIHGMDDNGDPPSSASLLADAITLEQDRAALRAAVLCHLRGLRDQYRILEFSIGAVTSLGPQGNCGGVQMTYQFAVNNTSGCDC